MSILGKVSILGLFLHVCFLDNFGWLNVPIGSRPASGESPLRLHRGGRGLVLRGGELSEVQGLEWI